jgi:serine/threonine protein kinase
MTPKRGARVTSIFRAALEKPAGERVAFLDEACGGDESLHRDVERLLAGEAEPSLESPLPDLLETDTLDFGPGETLAQYRMEGKIGEGGMGAVYGGYDTRLQRKVALKVLAPERFEDLNRKRRLMREARAASGLNHPNIVTIYEIGSDRDVDFIAMEYVEGKRLDDLIPPKGLRPSQLLRYAVQVADALAKAHGAGILHRDLKPSNIMVTSEGSVKLLDFGLAKVLEPADSTPDAPTATVQQLTEEGAVVGTAAYMSPEQAEGRKLDARSDIFSFGSVLYEMVTGRKPFTADTKLALLTRIVNEEPQPPREIAPVPPDLEKMILRCLRKEPSRRYQTMADLKVALEDLETEISGPPVQASKLASKLGPSRRPAIRRVALFAAAISAAVLMTFISMQVFQRSPEGSPQRTVKFTITPANLVRGSDYNTDSEVNISRDGKHIAYVESQGGQLWIRDIDQEKARPVPGATAVYQTFWSPDNQSIGYSAGRLCGTRGGCDLVRIPVQGGTPALIVKLQGAFRRAFWSSDGETIVYCDTTGMYTVPARGGSPTPIIEHTHIEHPSFLELPGGRRAILYQTGTTPGKRDHDIWVRVVGEDQSHQILRSASVNPYPTYSPTGHIVYVDGEFDSTAIWAVPFSLEKLQTTGKAFPIAQHGGSPVVSLTGTLVYGDVPSDRKQLAWVDRSGGSLATIGEPQRQEGPTLSPDGRRLVVEITEGDPDLWVYDLDRGIKSRFTVDPAGEMLGAWTPSGDQITYASNSSGNVDIFSKPSGGNGGTSLLVGTPLAERALDWSPDQRFLLYATVSPETKSDLLYRERRKDGSFGEPAVFLRTSSAEAAAQFSPDGHFVVYVSDESARNEVYVRDFPRGANKWQISSNGGTAPRWRRDGKEIFYVEEDRLMAASVTTRPAFSYGTPARLFERRYFFNLYPQYDVSADGKRFVILDKPAGEPPLSIHVVHNWFEEFRSQQRAPKQ